MRMRFRRVQRDEHGAIVMVVALSLIAMVGFSALVVDVGGLLVTRRRMVRASDSAALAAAQTCATTSAGSLAAAEGQADHYSGANQAPERTSAVDGSITDEDGCGTDPAGYVTVVYRIDQQTFFAPVLGLPDDYSVPAKATAIWGPAGSGSLPPLMVSTSGFQGDCDIENVEEAEPGADCNFWYSKDDLGSSTWGWLSLFTVDDPGPGGQIGWDVASDDTCPNSGANERNKWLDDPTPVPALNYPDPTFVCVDTGMVDANWSKLESKLPIELQFPVNDPDTQVDKDGNHTTDKPDKYNIVGFVTLLVTNLYDGSDPEVLGTPPTGATEVECPGQPIVHDFSQAEPTLDLSEDIGDCEVAVGQPVVEPPDVNAAANKWEYDGDTDVLTWTGGFNGQNGKNVEITLSYIQPGTEGEPGVCGPHFDGKNQDKCMVAQWVGFTTDGGEPGGGADFGNRPVRLCAPPDEQCS